MSFGQKVINIVLAMEKRVFVTHERLSASRANDGLGRFIDLHLTFRPLRFILPSIALTFLRSPSTLRKPMKSAH